MYIKHLYIDSFAALKGKELSLSEGLNVIEGLNESGKSTVCTFDGGTEERSAGCSFAVAIKD